MSGQQQAPEPTPQQQPAPAADADDKDARNARLLANAKARRAAREKTDSKEVSEKKPKPVAKPAAKPAETPKVEAKPTAKPTAKPAETPKVEANPEQEQEQEQKQEQDTDASDQARQEFRAQKRKFTRYVARTEAALANRELQVKTGEARVNELLSLVEKDPVEFVKRSGRDLRKLLLEFAEADAQDPQEKRISNAERLAEEARRDAEQLRAQREAEQARTEVSSHIARWYRSEVDAYPYLRANSEGPAEVVELATTRLIDHYRVTGQELDKARLFAMLEAEVSSHPKARKPPATEASASEPPDQVRTVASQREAVNPEPASPRRAADVSQRESRAPSRDDVPVGRLNEAASSRREQLMGRLIEKAKAARIA